MSESTAGWAVVNRYGHIMIGTVRRTKRETIVEFLQNGNWPWRKWRDKYGLRCIRIEVRKVKHE